MVRKILLMKLYPTITVTDKNLTFEVFRLKSIFLTIVQLYSTWHRFLQYSESLIYTCITKGQGTIAGLDGWWSEQKHFSLLGTKPYFHMNSSRKILLYWPLTQHQHDRLVTWLKANDWEVSLYLRKPRRDFRLLTSDFRVPTSDFGLPTSSFGVFISDCIINITVSGVTQVVAVTLGLAAYITTLPVAAVPSC